MTNDRDTAVKGTQKLTAKEVDEGLQRLKKLFAEHNLDLLSEEERRELHDKLQDTPVVRRARNMDDQDVATRPENEYRTI